MAERFVHYIPNFLEFSNVLNISFTASWLVLAVLTLRLLLKKAPKWIHVALWGLVAFRLIVPFSIESSFSLIPSAETLPKEILRYEGEQLAEPAYLEVVTNPVISEGVTVELNQSVDRVQINAMYATFVWWIGMAVMVLYTVVSYLRLCIKVQTAVRLRENIFQSEYVETPFVLGLIRPRIYMPYKIAEEDVPYVIAHEQTHICRKDNWWKPLGFLLLTIHWFNPLMWIAYILLCKDIELACDEKVVKELEYDQRADYSQALLSCSVSRRGIAACPLAFGEVGVKERVKSVLNYKKPAFWLVVAAILACAVVAVCFLTNPVTGEGEMNAENVRDTEDDTASPWDTDTAGELSVDNDTEGFVSGGYENYYDDYNDYYTVSYDVKLGETVNAGSIYVEQWYGGVCVKSIPGILSKEAREISIQMITDRGATGGEVAVWTDTYEGEWRIDYTIPEDVYMYGWRFETHGGGERLELSPNDEKILAIMAYDGGKLQDSVLKEPRKLEDEVGYAVVVRAVFGNGAPEEQVAETEIATEERNWYADIGFDFSEVVTVADEATKAAYIEALEQICYEHTAPSGEEWQTAGEVKFAIQDVDLDGREELVLQCEQGWLHDRFLIYDYDEKANVLRCELSVHPELFTFYENGYVEEKATRNWGMSDGTDFWPYSVYKYNAETDSYDLQYTVDAWDKERAETAWTEDAFSDEADKDGDGRLFFVIPQNEEIDYDEPMDNAGYEEWRKTIESEIRTLEFYFTELPYVMPEAAA